MTTMTRDDLLLRIRSQLADTITHSDEVAREVIRRPASNHVQSLHGDWPGSSALVAALSAAGAGASIGLLWGIASTVIGWL